MFIFNPQILYTMKTPFLSKLFFGAAILSLSLMTSCKDDKAATEADANNTAGTTSTTPNSTASDDKEVAQVNPAHGLPGHRCDIPVGAPLNSAAAMQTTPAATTTTSSNVSPIRVDKTPTVNPPHGEPGHSCSIPVGAPLE